MTVLKPQSTLTTGQAVGDTAPGLKITFGASAPSGQSALILQDFGPPPDLEPAPIFFIAQKSNGTIAVWGDYLSAWSNIIGGSFVGIDGVRNPPCLIFPDGNAAQGLRLWSGSGVPGAGTIGGAAQIGDIYIRTDTPTTSNQRVYHCTVAGTPGTWAARL